MQPSPPSTTTKAETPEPYRYGWRYVQKTMPDGSVTVDQVPLTLEDVLHPQEGDVIIERRIHELDCRYLADVFTSRPIEPGIASVTADLLVDWDVEGMRDTSPDIGVFVGLNKEPDLEEGTFHLAESGGRCLLVIEVVSPHTRVNDVDRKMKLYHQAKVPLYLIIDQEHDGGPRQLLVYEWSPDGFVQLPLDDQGRFLLSDLGLYLLVRDGRAVCLDAATGRELGDYPRLVRELEEAKQQLEDADRRIQEQEHELEEATLQLRQTKKLAEERAEALEKAEKLAEDRAQALQKAEEQLTELQALLARMNQGPPETT